MLRCSSILVLQLIASVVLRSCNAALISSATSTQSIGSEVSAWVTTEDGTQTLIVANSYADTDDCRSVSCFKWLTIGSPRIKPASSISAYRNLPGKLSTFQFNRKGFSIRVKFTSNAQRLALLKAIESQYGAQISPEQISEVPVNRLTCQVKVSEYGVDYEFRGTAKDFSKRPVVVQFNEFDRAYDIVVAERQLSVWNSPKITDENFTGSLDDISCKAAFFQQSGNSSSLKLQGPDFDNLLDLVFASANKSSSTYLTWTQFTEFARQLHKLRNVGDFGLSVVDFASKLYDELISKQAAGRFSAVDISDALASLSSFASSNCSAEASGQTCTANDTLTDLSSLLTQRFNASSGALDQYQYRYLVAIGRISEAKYRNFISLGSKFEEAASSSFSADLVKKLNRQSDSDLVWSSDSSNNCQLSGVKALLLQRNALQTIDSLASVSKADGTTIFSAEFQLPVTREGLLQAAASIADDAESKTKDTLIPPVNVKIMKEFGSKSSTSSGEAQAYTIITASTNWTVPSGVSSFSVLCIGGGGGGGPQASESTSTCRVAGGGGGSGYLNLLRMRTSPGKRFQIIIGEGGRVGNNGGKSIVLSDKVYMTANGGSLGGCSTGGNGGSGGGSGANLGNRGSYGGSGGSNGGSPVEWSLGRGQSESVWSQMLSKFNATGVVIAAAARVSDSQSQCSNSNYLNGGAGGSGLSINDVAPQSDMDVDNKDCVGFNGIGYGAGGGGSSSFNSNIQGIGGNGQAGVCIIKLGGV